jgi:uncharacterized SAM-binding protein YcdF (DUF218 family)
MKPNNEQLAETLWNYLKMDMPLIKADVIIALGSHDTKVAQCAAELYKEGWSPLIVMSGGIGRLTNLEWQSTEAKKFTEIANKLGVPEDKIMQEDKSTNTGENINYSEKLLEENKIFPKTIIAVHTPYMERRAYGYFKKQWPNVTPIMASPKISYRDYKIEGVTREDIVSTMVGEIQRLEEYPKKGFIAELESPIPDNVLQAYKDLIKLGFSKYLI